MRCIDKKKWYHLFLKSRHCTHAKYVDYKGECKVDNRKTFTYYECCWCQRQLDIMGCDASSIVKMLSKENFNE